MVTDKEFKQFKKETDKWIQFLNKQITSTKELEDHIAKNQDNIKYNEYKIDNMEKELEFMKKTQMMLIDSVNNLTNLQNKSSQATLTIMKRVEEDLKMIKSEKKNISPSAG